MQNTPLVRYALDLPEALLDKVRLISAERKVSKRKNKTQKAILVELLEKGLLFADDDLPPSNFSTTL